MPLQLLSIVPPIDADVVNIRTGRDVTVHGFRSAFRDWAGDEGEVPRELAEASLAHVVKDATERAYRRKTAVERVLVPAGCYSA